MITNQNNSFIVPVIFVTAKDLELTIENNPYIPHNISSSSRQHTKSASTPEHGVSSEELAIIKTKLKKQIEYKFYQLRDMAKHLTPDQIRLAHFNMFKSIFQANIDNIPCLSAIKTKSINGMTYDQILYMHINKFKEMYTLHNNMFNYDIEFSARTPDISNEGLMINLNKFTSEINLLFRNISSTLENLSIEQALQIYEMLIETIISLHCDNATCFNNIKANGINGITYENIVEMYLKNLKETFNLHVHLLT